MHEGRTGGQRSMPTPHSVRSRNSERTDEDSECAASTATGAKASDPNVTTPSSCEGSLRSPRYQVDHIGRHMKSSKLRHAWTFFLESTELKVELEHSRFSGKKKVLVDGKPVFATTEKQLSWCWEHPNTKAKILLESENGRHSLRCEEPEKLEQGPNEQLQSVSPRSCRSTTSVTGSRTPKTPAAEIDMAAEEVRQSLFGSFSDELQEHMDALDEEIAEEAIPSFPSCLTTRSQRRVSQEEVDTETARLNALLGVKNAQIAALQDELRRCALSKEGPAPAVDATPHAAPAPAAPEPVSPIQQLEGPKQPEHFLVAELPTLPVTPARERVVTPRRPASRNCSPGPNHQQPQPSPAVRRSSLDDEELDVSHRRGPVVSTPTPGTPCAAGRCMTPPRVSPVVVQRYVATPRRALTPPRRVVVAPQVEAPDTPIARLRGRAGSMPPPQQVPCASPLLHWRYEPCSGRPGRASTPYRSLSVQPPQRWRSSTPGPQHRSTAADAMLQVPRPVLHAPMQCHPPPRSLVAGGVQAMPLQPPQMPRPMPLPVQVALPAPTALRALGPPPLLAPVMWRPDARIMGQPQPWVKIGQ